MNPPRIKISPDGRLYVRHGFPQRPWLLYAPNQGFVICQFGDALTDAKVEDWPEYAPPAPAAPEESTP